MSAADDQREADNKQVVLDIFARNLRRWRQERGLSLKALAKISGVAEMSLVAYERGRKTAGIDKVAALAKALDVTVSDLLDDSAAVIEQSVARYTHFANLTGLYAEKIGGLVAVGAPPHPATLLDKQAFVFKMETLVNYALALPLMRKVARYAFFGDEESE